MRRLTLLASFIFAVFVSNVFSQQNIQTPINFKALPILSNTAILIWTPVAGATQYEILDCSNNQVLASVQESNYKLTGLVIGETKQYKIKAISGTSHSDYTSCIDVKIVNDPFNIFK